MRTRHLLKNIYRRKPVHSHLLHNQGNSSGPSAKAEKQELKEEIERLKQEKHKLFNELQKHTKQRNLGSFLTLFNILILTSREEDCIKLIFFNGDTTSEDNLIALSPAHCRRKIRHCAIAST
ncbi:hypothetical protein C4D60_Mb09t04930 [Musa balbisiana]|uniref:Uncharacterized protein n=1 Tax=Musa balbisiana TaxID=52838 RepID=A0A4V4H312_MUSBA|nr:hypothetical protein C4D60_Mb09t04930 [Musa balbisiana]